MIASTNSLDFSQIIENSLTGIMILSENEVFYANQHVYNLLGYEVGEPLIWDEILHPDYKFICQNRIRAVVEKKITVEPMEQKLIHKEGSIIHVEIFALPYINNKKTLAQMHIQDITKRKIYERDYLASEQQYQLISENISDVISEIDVKGVIKYISPSVGVALGYSPEEMIGTRMFDYIHPEDQVNLKVLYKNLERTKQASVFRCRLKNKNCEYLWFESKGKLFYRQEEQRLIVDSIDITEQVEAEKLLRQSEKLALIGELSAGVVHEIKNPLTSIKGFLQLMKAGTIKTNDYISILNTEVERIEQIANDLLGFAKPKEDMKELDMNNIVKDVVFLLKPQAKNKNINLRCNSLNDSAIVFGDKTQLKQVLVNLVKNAIEASADNQKVEIDCFRDKGKVIVQVKDNGCGIPKEYLDKVGESFFTTKEKGTGLGLMVTQKIITNHKGNISIQSEVDKGTIFTIELLEVFGKD